MALMKMKDVCLKIGSGATPRGGKEAYIDSGISLIRSQNVLDFGFTYDGLAHINEQQAEKLNNVIVESGDVLLNITGDSVARVCMVEDEVLPARVNQHVAIVRANKEIVLGSYILYFLQMSKPYLLQLAAGGATRNALTKGMIEDLEIEIPYIQEQKRIVSLVDDIQRKIRVNEGINDNLTQQARSLYQAWFVDYEPFGGSAPSDWSNVSLGQVAIMKTESWSPVKNPDDVVEHYSIPAYDEQHYPVFESATDIKSNKYILTPDSVMISKLNPDTKRIWRPMCLSANPVCSTEFIVYEARKNDQKDYIYSILDSVPFFNYLCAHTTGSTNSRQRATPKATLDFSFQLPPDNIIKDFCQIVTPMYDLIASNIVENQSLAQTRDGLLPRLMSGELDVSDIDI